MNASGMETQLKWASIVISVCLVAVGCGSSGQHPSDGGPSDAETQAGDVAPGVDGHVEGDSAAETGDVPGTGAGDAATDADATDAVTDAETQDGSGAPDVADNQDAAGRDAVAGSDGPLGGDVCVTG